MEVRRGRPSRPDPTPSLDIIFSFLVSIVSREAEPGSRKGGHDFLFRNDRDGTESQTVESSVVKNAEF